MKKLLITLLIVITNTISLTHAEEEIAGVIQGKLNINQGTANYSIPIQAPPGIANMVPGIAINSNNSISGIFQITRGGRTYAQDGVKSGINYDEDDRYFLNGKRLIFIKEDETESHIVSEYRTEIDEFSIIKSFKSNGKSDNFPDYFEVLTNAGKILYYGDTEDSKVKAQDTDIIDHWKINKIEDLSGNEIMYEYESVGDTSTAIHKILYANNEIVFNYEDKLSNVITKYVAGIEKSLNKRLSSIETYTNNGLVKKYTLNYEEEGPAKINRLNSITECDKDNNCLRPTTFIWQDEGEESFSPAETWINDFYKTGDCSPCSEDEWYHKNSLRTMADVNGDGLADIVGFGKNKVEVSIAYSNKGNDYFKSPENWINFYAYHSDAGKWRNNKHLRFMADVNGDGMADIVGFGYDGVYVSLSTGKFFEKESLWIKDFGYNRDKQWTLKKQSGSKSSLRTLADVNGDGRIDIVGFGKKGVYVSLSQGDKFSQKEEWSTEYGYEDWKIDTHPRFLVDVNSDGMADIVGFGEDGTYVSLSTGESFGDKKMWLKDYSVEQDYDSWNNYPRLLGDINGDGNADIVAFGSCQIYTSFSNGKNSFTDAKGIINGGEGMPNCEYGDDIWDSINHPFYLSDMNNDGMADFVGFGKKGVDVLLSKGDGDFTNFKPNGDNWVTGFGSDDGWKSNSNPRFLKDVNGDGLLDIVGFGGKGVFVATSNLKQTGLLLDVDNGIDKTDITYQSFIKRPVYEIKKESIYPVVDLEAPIYVVKNVVKEIESSNKKYVNNYVYSGLKYDLEGRGNLGFGWIRTSECELPLDKKNSCVGSIYIDTTYSQSFPKIGMIEKSKVRKGSSEVVTETKNNIMNLTTVNEKIHYPFIKSSTEKKYKYKRNKNKLLVSKKTIFNNKDLIKNFGHIKGQTEIITDYSNSDKLKYITTSNNIFHKDEDKLLLGRIIKSTITKKSDLNSDSKRITTFDYEDDTNLITETIVEPYNENLYLKTAYEYDDFGNVIETTISDKENNQHTTKITYTIDGKFPETITNAIGHKLSFIYDEAFGNIRESKDNNNLVTTYEYDSFGREIEVTAPDGVVTNLDYSWYDDEIFLDAIFKITESTGELPPVITYYDFLDRKVRIETVGFDGKSIYTDIKYNRDGQVTNRSLPYFEGETIYWEEIEYNHLGRVIKKSSPGSDGKDLIESNIKYDGLKIETTNSENQKKTLIQDALGRTIKVEQEEDTYVSTKYDNFDNIIETDANGIKTKMTYDELGRKIAMEDPDMGEWSYEYNAFGETTKQTDAIGQEITNEYDELSRITKTFEPEGNAIRVYDDTTGQLEKIEFYKKDTTTPNHIKHFEYDEFSRLIKTTITIDNEEFTTENSYDEYGRIKTNSYPNDYKIHYSYNDNNFLEKIEDNDENLIWKAIEMDSFDRIIKEEFANGITTSKTYDSGTAQLNKILTKKEEAREIQNIEYEYDTINNLSKRYNLITNIEEKFSYDKLNRLTDKGSIFYTYDSRGNILSKSNYEDGNAEFQYNNDNNRLTGIEIDGTVKELSYDENGNLTTNEKGTEINWTSFNKPKEIVPASGSKITFDYDSEHQKYRKIIADKNQIITYIDGFYEKVDEGANIFHNYYIYADGKVVAQYKKTESGLESDSEYLYFHNDYQNSVKEITNSSSNVTTISEYSPFGIMRQTYKPVDIGYTGHKHIEISDEESFIDMNARLQDPNIGRFISPDSIVSDPLDSQSYNRFSYVLNNPLKYTDPSGHSPETSNLPGFDDGTVGGNWTDFEVNGVSSIKINLGNSSVTSTFGDNNISLSLDLFDPAGSSYFDEAHNWASDNHVWGMSMATAVGFPAVGSFMNPIVPVVAGQGMSIFAPRINFIANTRFSLPSIFKNDEGNCINVAFATSKFIETGVIHRASAIKNMVQLRAAQQKFWDFLAADRQSIIILEQPFKNSFQEMARILPNNSHGLVSAMAKGVSGHLFNYVKTNNGVLHFIDNASKRSLQMSRAMVHVAQYTETMITARVIKTPIHPMILNTLNSLNP
jgi:RHS repeat-associated protein